MEGTEFQWTVRTPRANRYNLKRSKIANMDRVDNINLAALMSMSTCALLSLIYKIILQLALIRHNACVRWLFIINEIWRVRTRRARNEKPVLLLLSSINDEMFCTHHLSISHNRIAVLD